MENMSLSQALAGPYVSFVSSTYAVATNYHGVGRPSLPNYLALTSGDTYGIQDDGYHALPSGGIGQQLSGAGIAWRAYMEGMTKGCMDSPYPYALKHNPFAYYGGSCPSNVVPLSQFATDLQNDPPRFAWITPDLCHDGHDCPVSQADAWLSGFVPMILATPAWRNGGALFIVWDEGDPAAANQMPLLVITPDVKIHQSAQPYDHYSLLATIEDLLGLPRLGQAAQSQTLTDLVPALTVKR
jgi:phospholipase C